jgi:dienelactone hydrolase
MAFEEKLYEEKQDREVMEQKIKIRTPDKKTIYGVLTKGSKDKLIIFVHGLTGHINEHIFYNGAEFFSKKGYSVFRFGLYSSEKGSRAFADTHLGTYNSDVTTVLKHFKKFKKIFLIGHSLGGPSILLGDFTMVNGIVLWDPSTDLHKEVNKWYKYDKKSKLHLIDWGMKIVAGERLHKDMLNPRSMVPIVKKSIVPIRVITAGEKGFLTKKWKGKVKDLVIIPKADHNFDEEGTEEQLFKKTLEFLRKI